MRDRPIRWGGVRALAAPALRRSEIGHRSETAVWFGIAAMLAGLVLAPRGLQNAVFFAGLASVLAAARHEIPPFVAANRAFFLLLAVLCAVLAASSVANGIPLGVYAADVGSIATIGLFVFAANKAFRLSPSGLLTLVVVFASLAAAIGVLQVLASPFTGASMPHGDRLMVMGKGHNPIHAGSLLAVGFFAGLALWQRVEGAARAGLAVGMAVTLVALIMTWSRGPIVSFALALALTAASFALRRRSGLGVRLAAACLAAWAAVTALGFVEPLLRGWTCEVAQRLCRGDTLRLEIWGWVADEVRSHPLLGKGMSFRFPPPDHFHAHNGLFGMALAFGVPALLLFLGVLYRVGARAPAAAPSGMTILFATLTLTFGFAYMGSDLSSPVAFVRNHYLFLWLPVSMLMLAGVPQAEQGEPRRADDGRRSG